MMMKYPRVSTPEVHMKVEGRKGGGKNSPVSIHPQYRTDPARKKTAKRTIKNPPGSGFHRKEFNYEEHAISVCRLSLQDLASFANVSDHQSKLCRRSAR